MLKQTTFQNIMLSFSLVTETVAFLRPQPTTSPRSYITVSAYTNRDLLCCMKYNEQTLDYGNRTEGDFLNVWLSSEYGLSVELTFCLSLIVPV